MHEISLTVWGVSKVSCYQLVLSVGSSADGPRLAVACAAVRRMQANKKYIPRDYEVSTTEGEGLV